MDCKTNHQRPTVPSRHWTVYGFFNTSGCLF